MTTLRIEHAITDFDTWKAAFDRDPLLRKESGVRSYVVRRPVDEPRFVLIDMEFDDAASAQNMLVRLEQLWKSSTAAPAFAGSLRTRIADTVDAAQIGTK